MRFRPRYRLLLVFLLTALFAELTALWCITERGRHIPTGPEGYREWKWRVEAEHLVRGQLKNSQP